MKVKLVIFVLVITFFTNFNFANENNNQDEKTLWKFSQMLVISNAMIKEAHKTKDYRFIELSTKYLNYAENILTEFEDTNYVEKGQEIVDFLSKILTVGINPTSNDRLASGVATILIRDFNRSIYIKKIIRGRKNE